MATTYLVPADLTPLATIDEAKAAAMIEDAEAMAALAAPCITEPEFQENVTLAAAVKAILRGAVLRWNDAGSGALQQVGAGSFQASMDTRQVRRSMFWPSEITQLRDLCAQFSNTGGRKAFAVDTAAGGAAGHAPWCNLMFLGPYCSCGANIAGHAIYE